ncbi:MAG: hypothetical protein A2Y12_01290 [Planctomycetes bacterium GWF2_42_9]|nr:MAG: hypothetical protein A2Y12_01290 [Planctomycetes bacterium GWF2_42_9]
MSNIKEIKPRFSLGQVVATRGAIDAFNEAGEEPLKYLCQYASGDWGKTSTEDKKLNDQAIAFEGNLDKQVRVLSVYELSSGVRIWIITEWDRSLTTILLPSEY